MSLNSNEKITILVTGATGFVGINLVKRFLEENYEVHCLVRKTSNRKNLISFRNKLLKFHNADLLDSKRLKKVAEIVKPTFIVHCANSSMYGGTDSDAKNSFEANFIGTVNLVNALQNIDYKLFINTGSSSEYGKKDFKMKESDGCFPESIYGISKLSATLFCNSVANNSKKPIVTLRLFSPYGPHDNPNRLIPYIVSSAIKNKDLEIENPNGIRDFIYIDDVVDAYLKTIKNSQLLTGKVLNIGTGIQSNVKNIVDSVLKVTKSKSKIIKKKNERLYEPNMWQADITKAKRLIGWEPKVTIERGIKKTVDWHKNSL